MASADGGERESAATGANTQRGQRYFDALSDDLLVQVFRRLDVPTGSATMESCKRFRDVYRKFATTVTLARKYILRRDDPLVAAMRHSPALKRVSASRAVLEAFHWPTASLTQISTLTVPVGWAPRDVPATLPRLVVTGSSTPPPADVRDARNQPLPGCEPVVHSARDAEWCADVMRWLAKTRSSCVVDLRCVRADGSDAVEWIDAASAPRLRVTRLHATSLAAATRVARFAPILQLRELRLEVYKFSDLLLGYADGVDLASLTALELDRCAGAQGVPGLFTAAAPTSPRLQRLHVCACEGLQLGDRYWWHAALTSLTELWIDAPAAAGQVSLLAAARLPALVRLRVGHSDMESLLPLRQCRMPRLECLRLDDCSCLTALSGLDSSAPLQGLTGHGGDTAPLSSLTEIQIVRCPALRSLDALQGMEFPRLRKLVVESCGLTSVEALDECRFPALEEVTLAGCGRLRSLEGLCNTPSLRVVDVKGCTAMTSLQALAREGLRKLKCIVISRCPELQFENLRYLGGGVMIWHSSMREYKADEW